MFIWGVVAYLVVFLVLDVPRLDSGIDPLPQADIPEEQVLEEIVAEAEPDEPQQVVAISEPDKDESEPLELSSSWMENTSLTTGWYVQIGSYNSTVEAEVERLKYNRINVPIHTDESEDQVIHLLAGPHKTESEAAQTTDTIKKDIGVSKVAIRWIERSDEAEQVSINRTQSEDAGLSLAEDAGGDQASSEPEVAKVVERPDTSQPSPEPSTASPEPSTASPEPLTASPEPSTATEAGTVAAAQPETAIAESEGNWYVQIGAFKEVLNARKLGEEVRIEGLPLKIDMSDSRLIRVLVGPYSTRNSAVQAQPEIQRALALDEAIIQRIEG